VKNGHTAPVDKKICVVLGQNIISFDIIYKENEKDSKENK
jgi:hypothetical protein